MKKVIKFIVFLFVLMLSITLIACGNIEAPPTPGPGPVDPTPIEEPVVHYDFSAIISALNRDYSNLKVDKDIELPKELNDVTLSWSCDSEYFIDGKYVNPPKDTSAKLSVVATKGEDTLNLSFDIVIKHKSTHTFDEVEEYLLDNYDGIVVNGDIEFPLYLEEFEAELEWESGEDQYLSSDGKFTAPILDLEDDIFVTVTLNGKQKEVDLCVTLKGWGTIMDVIVEWVKEQVPASLSTSIRLPVSHNRYESKITWTSSNEEAMTSVGMITKDPFEDKNVKLSCEIEYEGEKRNLEINVVVNKLSDAEKNYEVRDWLDSLFKDIEVVEGDLDLPTTDLKYGAEISWQTNSPGILTTTGKFNIPMFDRKVSIVATSEIGGNSISLTYEFQTYGKPVTDIWEGVEKVLSYIALDRISNFVYYTYGGQAGYEKNAVQEYGYLMFYTPEKSVITERILEINNGHCRPGTKKTSTEYIVVHDTWNTAPTAGALQHAKYLENVNNDPNGSYVSWHFVVDEDYAVQQVPLDEVAYHAGDGSHVFGETYYNNDYRYQAIGGGNRNGIGIETCVNFGCNYTNVMRRTARLVAELLIDFNLGLDRVKQHHDFSGKDCPSVMRHNNRWEEFLNMVEIFYYGKTTLKDVDFKWTSLSPDILDDEGHVINHPGVETEVKYKVDVTYQGVTKTYEFTSTLDAMPEE